MDDPVRCFTDIGPQVEAAVVDLTVEQEQRRPGYRVLFVPNGDDGMASWRKGEHGVGGNRDFPTTVRGVGTFSRIDY